MEGSAALHFISLQNAFDFFDSDKSGAIDFQELQEALVQIGFVHPLLFTHRIQLSPGTFQTVFFASDIDRSGSIQLDQFIKVDVKRDFPCSL